MSARAKVDAFIGTNPAPDRAADVATRVLSAFQGSPASSPAIIAAIQAGTKEAAMQARLAHLDFGDDTERARFVTAWIFWAIRHDSQECKDAIGKMLEWVGDLLGTDPVQLEAAVDAAIGGA